MTPMLRQYMAAKEQAGDAILMFRMGDFYEMFFDDAITAAKALQITLTSRNTNKEARVPMCGVPYHAARGYIAKLVRAGYRVAVCDQVEDPKKAKKLVKREITRTITPGTVIEDEVLAEKENSYLVAVCREGETWGLALADLSTGEFRVAELSSPERLWDELVNLQPKECLLPEEHEGDLAGRLHAELGCAVTHQPGYRFLYETAVSDLCAHLGVASLAGFGVEDMKPAVGAAGAILDYLRGMQKSAVSHINTLGAYSVDDFVVLDRATQRNLELTHSLGLGGKAQSLLGVIDRTVTPMGGRMLRGWLLRPLIDVPAIRRRQGAVGELVDEPRLLESIRDTLSEVGDIERLAGRVGCGAANARDLLALRASLERIPIISSLLEPTTTPYLNELQDALQPLDDVVDLIGGAIAPDPPAILTDGGLIRSGYDGSVDELRDLSTAGKGWIAALQKSEAERTGIGSLKVGYNKVFGYYIEVSKPNLPKVPESYIRKQTLVNAERFITPELKDKEAEVLGASERLKELEYEIFRRVRDEVAAHLPAVQSIASAYAQLDCLASLSDVALRQGYICPTIDDSDVVEIEGGRHPVVECIVEVEGFVPNDTHLDCGAERLLIITGPNMAGKSTYIRQVALICLLAQVGGFVPAASARIGVVDRIFTRIGASDDLSRGTSTFLMEMQETANILANATGRSLVILDEIGRGTSTFDGMSIAWAVCEHITRKLRCRTLFATHYHELTQLALDHPGVANYNVAVREHEGGVVFLRKVVPGGSDRSYGIHVAELAGLPPAVIDRAKVILEELESADTGGAGGGAGGAGAAAGAGTPHRGRVPDEEGAPLQLTFFQGPPDPVVDELRGVDVDNLTPLDAMNLLHRLKKEVE